MNLGLFLGDIHGRFNDIPNALKQYASMPGWKNLYQLGDFGLGFRSIEQEPGNMGQNVHFIRGNHDDPDRCRAHPNYMGDYGVTPNGIFFIGGAWSIDWQWRLPGRSWWEDEELPYSELQKAIDLYAKTKPDIVISHTCPASIVPLFSGMSHKSYTGQRTETALKSMLDIHRPKTWIFGHWHIPFDKEIIGTRFVCIMPNESKLIPI